MPPRMPTANFILPPGRIVSGNVSRANPNDMHGKPRARPQYFFAVAVAKNAPGINELLKTIYDFGMAMYGQFQNCAGAAQQWLQPHQTGFAWKIEDGDWQKNASKPGYAGCYIFKFSGTFLPRCVNRDGQQIDPTTVQTGFWIDLDFSISPNGKTDHTAGLYMNYSIVRLLGYDDVIVPGPSVEQRFGTGPAPQVGRQQAPGGFPGGSPGGFGTHGQPPAMGGFGGGMAHNAVPPAGQPGGFGGMAGQPGNGQMNPAPASSFGNPAPGFGGHSTEPNGWNNGGWSPNGGPSFTGNGQILPAASPGGFGNNAGNGFAPNAGHPTMPMGIAPTSGAGFHPSPSNPVGNGPSLPVLPASVQDAPAGVTAPVAPEIPVTPSGETASRTETPSIPGFAHGAAA